MKARKCDRCGKFYEEYNGTEETKSANALRLMGVTQTAAHGKNWYDLCEDCMKELVSFLDTPPEAPEEPVEPPVEDEEGEGDTDPTDPDSPEDGPIEGKGEEDSREGT